MWEHWMRGGKKTETKKMKGEAEDEIDSEEEAPIYLAVPSQLRARILEADQPAASSSGSGTGSGLRRRGGGSGPDPHNHGRRRSPPIFITPTGVKYHVRENCDGLRNAHSVHEATWCPTCKDLEIVNDRDLYTGGVGHPMHKRFYTPCAMAGPRTRTLTPCRVCVPAHWPDED